MTLGFPPWRREALRTTAGPAWRRCSARWTSSKIYSRLALADAQQRYDQVITRAPSDPRRYLAAWATFGRTGPTRTRMANFTERGHVRANSRSRQESKIVKCYLQPPCLTRAGQQSFSAAPREAAPDGAPVRLLDGQGGPLARGRRPAGPLRRPLLGLTGTLRRLGLRRVAGLAGALGLPGTLRRLGLRRQLRLTATGGSPAGPGPRGGGLSRRGRCRRAGCRRTTRCGGGIGDV